MARSTRKGTSKASAKQSPESQPSPEIITTDKWQVFGRPWSALSGLPQDLRWEITRRHGYYVAFWDFDEIFEKAAATRDLTEQERLVDALGSMVLKCIGYTGPSIDPSMSAQKIVQKLFPLAMDDSIEPLTLRSLLRLLLIDLRFEEQNIIGCLFRGAADPADIGETQFSDAIRIAASPHLTWLDRMPPGLHLTIDPFAPLQLILDEVKKAVKDQKTELGIRETRRRHEEIPKYLEVWDRREGWLNGAYHGKREKTFKQIAKDLKRPLSTVVSQYRSAFEAITGHKYNSYIWLRVFGILKLSEFFGSTAIPARSLARMNSALARDGVFAQGNNASDEGMEDEVLDPDAFALAEQIVRMLKDGRSTIEIAESLDLKEDRLVERFRTRLDEGLL